MFRDFTNKIGNIFSSKRIDENSLTELEELLLTADVGIETADKIINKLRNEKFSASFDINEIKSKLSKIMLDIIEPYQGCLPNIDDNKPTIILCIGVNGSGKTTTIAKLAHHYNNMNYKIILGAADTFRAAATEQLSEWSKELGLEIITGIHNSDPASIAYRCVENTLNNDFDIGIIDTAGRLQNRSDLMEQLKKIYKVIESKNNYLNQKTIMIIDGTTGQSSIKQVEEFSKYAKIDGLILSKLDGSAVGGTIISIIDYLKIPIQTLKVSSYGAHNLLGLAKEKNARILVASTSEVYGDPEVHPQTEDYYGNVNPVGPRGVYDEAKRYMEAVTMAYNTFHGVETRIIRIFNTYGPNMHPNDGRVVSNFIMQALTNKDITVYGNGDQTRSFCYIDDLINGMMSMMSSKKGLNGPINLGNPVEFKIKQLAMMIIKLTNSKSKIINKELPIDDPVRRRPDISKAISELNWEPKIDVMDGLKETIDYFRKKTS